MDLPDEATDLPPYPHTPEERRNSFVAQVRGVEEALFALSQDLYYELSQIWNEPNPGSHSQALEDMKRVFNERITKIGFDDSLTEVAASADQAWGMAPVKPGDS